MVDEKDFKPNNVAGFWGVTDFGGNEIVPVKYDVDAGAVSTILMGQIVDFHTSQYVKEAANGATTSALWCGIAASDSDETATADGEVDVYRHPAGLLAFAKATTPANLAATVLNTIVTLDVTGTVHTVDENDTSAGAMRIRDYDSATGVVLVEVPCRTVLWT